MTLQSHENLKIVIFEMDNPSLNHYEEQLYSVFKTFDVNNEEALDKASVVALCDALQLEERGATLVETLFERRAGAPRITFAQFRSGLLSVLGAGGEPPPRCPDRSDRDHNTPHSDDDSSGREVAPKFVFGSKKYGRRSRPQRTTSAPEDVSKLTSLEESVEPPDRARRRYRSSRSVCSGAHSSMDNLSTANLLSENVDHDTRIDCEQALALCRQLHMDNIDRQMIEQIFKTKEVQETTVGEFFERLNASLSNSIEVSSENIGEETVSNAISHIDNTDSINETLPNELVMETWENAGIQEPRQLLSELGFNGITLVVTDLEQVLEGEICTLNEPCDPRYILLTASLALSRLCKQRAQATALTAITERNRLRADVAECNKRARILAQEVDENHARLENDLKANLKRAESRHAETLRAIEAELYKERERAAAERAALEQELTRRADTETRLRQQLDAATHRVIELETCVSGAEARAQAVEAEHAQLCVQLKEMQLKSESSSEEDAAVEGKLAARLELLRQENKQLLDRCDELCAELEARGRGVGRAERAAPESWRDEARAAVPTHTHPSEECDSSLASIESRGETTEAELQHAVAQTEPADGEVARLRRDKQSLQELVKELEANLEEMRLEYERCEEYWSGKLAEERELQAAEQRAGDARLAELAARIAEYERQFAPRAALPTIEERPSLELQVTALEEELERVRLDRNREAQARHEDAARLRSLHDEVGRLRAQLERLRGEARGGGGREGRDGRCGGCAQWAGAWRAEAGAAAALRARAARAEAAVVQLTARLSARLAAADLLVKDLYVESCRSPLPPPRRL